MEIVDYGYVMYGNFKCLTSKAKFEIGGTSVLFQIHYPCDNFVYARAIEGTKFNRVRRLYLGAFSFVVKGPKDYRFINFDHFNLDYGVYTFKGSVAGFYNSRVPVFNPRHVEVSYGNYNRTPQDPNTPLRLAAMEDTMGSRRGIGFTYYTEGITHQYYDFYGHNFNISEGPPESFKATYLADFIDEMAIWCYNSRKHITEQNAYWLGREADRIRVNEVENYNRYLNRQEERVSCETVKESVEERLNVL